MVAQERAIRFGCALAAALFVLVLAGCADVSESGSSPRAQPSKKNPPAETAERPTLLWRRWASQVHRQVQTDSARHARTFLRAAGAPLRTSLGGGYVLS